MCAPLSHTSLAERSRRLNWRTKLPLPLHFFDLQPLGERKEEERGPLWKQRPPSDKISLLR